jgi:hypothetical protein
METTFTAEIGDRITTYNRENIGQGAAMTVKEAQAIAQALIKDQIGSDQKVTNMPSFFGAIVQALLAVYEQGWQDRAALGSGPR